MKNIFLLFIRLNIITLIIITSTFMFVQCSKQDKNKYKGSTEENRLHEENAHDHEEAVQFAEAELKEFGINLAIAGPGELEQHVDLTGEIGIDPDRLAHIFPRFPGIVKKVNKKIGDPVHKNDVLAIIESNESLSPYNITSLIDGTVLDMHLTPGEVVSDADHKITVSDLSVVWANLNVYQKDLAFIKVGHQAEISAGLGTKPVIGTISYISPVVDEQTRTAQIRIVLTNKDGRWKPGLFISARVIIGQDKVAIIAPKTALQTFESQTVIFVKDREGFEPRPVSIGRSNTKSVEITSGLKVGQEYVAKGGFTLKAELQKGSFGEGHEH